ncbi:DNA alkylation repair protein [Paenibacillus sp. 598K]|uniref:DNA alkylation repair protein n=1 Tax=Paenibacillus sp. 598K TaxID=1117987 RepID=UPI000FF9ED82|nr:DNA alkylation repair protein [Paenibacillus sp. 598K]GBF71883.1 DNA alkylation repair protein [Paenibacillus sp. 598K]
MNESKSIIPEEIRLRKGARTAKELTPEVLDYLNSGAIESVNLTEWLAVDHIRLLEQVASELTLHEQGARMLLALEATQGQSTMKVIAAIAEQWLIVIGAMQQADGERLLARLVAHPSDSVRCWATFATALSHETLEDKLSHSRPYAADRHFGVREIAWMAVRDAVAADAQAAITLLTPWVADADANIRRFAVEATRPRGVWARHIAELKTYPEWALPLLEPLKADPSKYVQDSVANWLNDASKTRPEWVVDVCQGWLRDSDHPATKRMASRAQRSLPKG